MVKGKGFKFGDTLVEVSIAIGIFSMVAIATVMVINASTSSTQAILEATITRDEIDAQAEALRFIQAAYSTGGEIDPNNPTSDYGKIWKELSDKAINLSTATAPIKAAVANYNPVTCSELYDTSNATSIIKQKGFIINPRALSSGNISDIIIRPAADSMGLFKETKTYPRIVYNNTAEANSLYNQSEESNAISASSFKITSVEGFYVIAVRDSDGTIIVSDNNKNSIETKSAYIDFYIRSCWFAPSADRPSTISTVIRLYDPSSISANKYKQGGIIINYQPGASNVEGTMPSQYIVTGSTVSLLQNQFIREGYVFNGWKDDSGNVYPPPGSSSERKFTAINNNPGYKTINMTALWKQYRVTFNYQSGSCPTNISGTMPSNTSLGSNFTIPNNLFNCAHHRFVNWKATIDNHSGSTENKTFNPGDSFIPYSPNGDQVTVTLEATWSPIYTVIYDSGIASHECSKTAGCKLSTSKPERSGFSFLGWCTAATSDSSCAGTTYQPGATLPASAVATYDTYLYAIWKSDIKSVRIAATWRGSCDYDSYLRGQNNAFEVYYGNRNYSYTLNNIQYTIRLNQDGGYNGTSSNEQMTLNRIDGRNFYYYIRSRGGSSYYNYGYGFPYNMAGACSNMKTFQLKVVVQGLNDSGGVEQTIDTFESDKTNCLYWNVFAYKNGSIVKKDTCTDSPDTSY